LVAGGRFFKKEEDDPALQVGLKAINDIASHRFRSLRKIEDAILIDDYRSTASGGGLRARCF
jgi:hypothetical protein